jgi:endonuclease-3
LVKAHKLLRKQYEPVPRVERTLLDHLLFASLLENSSYAAAEQGLASLRKVYFDLNEIRVSSVTEIAEHVGAAFDPKAAAWNLRRILQSVFEATYSFDVESFKKKNLGQAAKDLSKFAGVTPFVLAYATQMGLDGHAIPIDRGAMDALLILGIVTPKEAESGEVPGLERAIPKNKGIEFGSLLHQLGVDLLTRPFAQEVRDFFVSINPEAKDRLPKRGAKKKSDEEAADAKPQSATKSEAAAKTNGSAKPLPAKTLPTKTAAKAAEKSDKSSPAKPADKKPQSVKDSPKPKLPAKSAARENDDSKKKKAAPAKKESGKSDAKGLSRSKPR